MFIQRNFQNKLPIILTNGIIRFVQVIDMTDANHLKTYYRTHSLLNVFMVISGN